MNNKVTIALVGAGSRGAESYGPHVSKSPYDASFVAVAEPRDAYRNKAISEFNIPQENAYSDWKELASKPKMADAAFITTQDKMHAEPAIALMKLGYHILLEKPMATNEEDCRAIIKTQKETGRILAVCHEMRYSRYAKRIQEIIKSKVLGDIVSIHHIEPIGYWHFAHSYVRGNWSSEKDSSPTLLAKSCHDLDIIRYWLGKPCKRISSFGSLMHFKKENQPKNAASRCMDCPKTVESACPYSAKKIYCRDRLNEQGWPNNIVSLDTSEAGMLEALNNGPYGQCVYDSNNDVVDHQVVNMEFEGGTLAAFTMSAFTKFNNRETWILGTKGQIRGNHTSITHYDFTTDKETVTQVDDIGEPAGATGHDGDAEITFDFIAAVAKNDPTLLSSSAEVSLESHLMVFAAERARKNNSVEEVH